MPRLFGRWVFATTWGWLLGFVFLIAGAVAADILVGADFWARAVAPSDALRRWYRHAPAKWPEFRKRYFAELDANPDGVAELRAQLGRGATTFLYGSKEPQLNNATALVEYLAARRGR
jgi:uncharacterized protein YeaO (DUF488 family)